DMVDAVIIAVPTEYHHQIAKDCLQKNKHVLVEKPITKTLDQAIELFQIAEEKNLALHIGHVERFNGAVQELKKIINDPYLIECHRIGPFAARVQNDSVVLDLMIHDIDLVLNIVNSKISTSEIVSRKIKSNLADIAVAQVKFENGVLANITSSRASQIKERTMCIHQKDAFIKLDFTTQDIFIHRHTSDSVIVGNNQLQYKQEAMIERLFVFKDNPLKQEIEYFANSIKSGKQLNNAKNDIAALELTLKLDSLVK
ncbi:Gfo/Idh/MocA family oxidoreductase, partial [Candidatus Dependentiae bacterium]|nr:Gfo/Idh/MocA family oxidoreductase [Candidatus Dependentiae bacterium]MCG2756528.1 Gfo/Idh/MocA family oxidoreductase [Candidatus Dependentiae bacterium]